MGAVDPANDGPELGRPSEKACVIAVTAGCHAIILDVISDGGEEEFARRKAW